MKITVVAVDRMNLQAKHSKVQAPLDHLWPRQQKFFKILEILTNYEDQEQDQSKFQPKKYRKCSVFLEYQNLPEKWMKEVLK